MADLMIPSIGEIPVFEKVNLNPEDFRNGIVVRTPNWLGDAVMAIPAILQLKKILPDFCGLFVVTPAPLKALFEALPFVNQVIPIADAHAFMAQSASKALSYKNTVSGVIHRKPAKEDLPPKKIIKRAEKKEIARPAHQVDIKTRFSGEVQVTVKKDIVFHQTGHVLNF
jgi:hypothetical protein